MPAAPHFDSRSRIFELDSCGGNGKVCLVYKNCTPGALFAYCLRNLRCDKNILPSKNSFPSLSYCSCHFPGVVAQKSEIWFLDRSLCWHFLTTTFTSYYRLMISHLGLPEWQYLFTPYGPSPQAKVSKVSHQSFSDCVL